MSRGSRRVTAAALLCAAMALSGCFPPPEPDPTDRTAPVLTLPAGLSVVTTGPEGTTVEWEASATDQVDGPVTLTCDPPSGAPFPIGSTLVTCTATDAAGNTGTGSFTVSVVAADTTPPTLTLPDGITTEAIGPGGATITWSAAATDDVDGEIGITCTPASNTTFPLGTTTVTCAASDAAGNDASETFDVNVVDTTAPVLTLPTAVLVGADGPDGAAVTWAASATDVVSGAIEPSCVPLSGTTFPVGTTVVECSATDAAGNTASGTFDVTVEVELDQVPPVLQLPGDIQVEATGTGGAVVPWSALATDDVDGDVPVDCVPGPGVFTLGTTVVECSATDAAGNTATGSFSVTVSDTTAPTLSLPTSFSVVAADESGATVTWGASAFDLVDGAVLVDCTPGPDTVFALGTTSVSCSATDAAGNVAAGGFDVTVEVGDPTNEPPVIVGFTSNDLFGGNVANRPVPLSRALTFLTTDPDGDPLECGLDVDGDGVFEQAVPNCAPTAPSGLPFLDGGNFPIVVIRTPGTHQITLRVSDGVNAPVEATTELTAAAATESFDIETIVEPDLLDPGQLVELDKAIERIETMIPTGLPSRFVDYDPDPDELGGWCDAFTGVVDDLTIRVTADTIDGPQNIGALGGYCASRWEEWVEEPYYGISLPAYGQVILDVDDIDWWHDAGVLDELFAHEIGHALGVGTSPTWRRFTGAEDTRRYTAGGLELWRNYGRTGLPPVQPIGSDGTNITGGDHWHEDHMGDELMTPLLSFSRGAQLSDLTLSFLAEAGYSVDIEAAEPYTPPPVPSGPSLRRSPTHQFGHDSFGPHSDPDDRPGS